jgi:hypothetical protein
VLAVCDGESAMDFATEYLLAFERLTAEEEAISRPLGNGEAGGLPGLGDRVAACAGVAIVKPHFPFTAGARLAYQLLREAKAVKDHAAGPCSALSFEVLYDSADSDLDRLRAAVTLVDPAAPAGRARLYAQPYVVTEEPSGLDDWMAGRHITDLRRRVGILTEFDETGERALPASQVHLLRDALHISPEIAERRFEALRARYPGAEAETLAGPTGSLFWEAGDSTITGLLDAMNAAGFLDTDPQASTSEGAS